MNPEVDGRVWLAWTGIVGSGLILGFYAESWVSIAVGSVIVGVAVNFFILIRDAIRGKGLKESLGINIASGLMAGLIDGLKIFLLGSLVRWTEPLAQPFDIQQYHLLAAILMFLTLLNRYLKGRQKIYIDLFFSAAWIGLLIVVGISAGLKAGLILLGLTIIYAVLARPFAARLATLVLRLR